MSYSVALLNITEMELQAYPKATIFLRDGYLIHWMEYQLKEANGDEKIIKPIPEGTTVMYLEDEDCDLEHTKDPYGVKLFYIETHHIVKVIDWLKYESDLDRNVLDYTIKALEYLSTLSGYLVFYWM